MRKVLHFLADLRMARSLPSRRPSFRPRLETLEGRLAPAVYHVDPAGDNNNPGTLAQPMKDLDNFVSYYCPYPAPPWCRADPEPPTHLQLQPGDTVEVETGVYNNVHRYGDSGQESHSFYLRGLHGTPDRPITIAAAPGAQPVFSARLDESLPDDQRAMAPVYLLDCSWIVLEGLEVKDAYGGGIFLADSQHIDVVGVKVHDNDCSAISSTQEGLHISHSTDVTVRDSYFSDDYDRRNPTSENNKEIGAYGGGNIHITGTHFSHSVNNTGAGLGYGVMYKHAAEVPGATFEVDNNTFANLAVAVGTGTSGSLVHDNLVIDCSSAGISVRDFGGPTRQQDEVFEHNTIVGSPGLYYRPTFFWAPIGSLTFAHNLVVDDTTTYNQDVATVIIGPYESDEVYDATVPKLAFADNLYWNPRLSAQFNLFNANGGDRGVKGRSYSFAEWQAEGRDAGSLNADPLLDADYRPRLPAAKDMGRRPGGPPINHAPILIPGGNPTVPIFGQGPAVPFGGTVAAVAGGSIADEDPGALRGIAVVGLAGAGSWQLSTDGGVSWTPFGPVSAGSARLVRDSDLVRFLPGPGYQGGASISYRAWDQTAGQPGGTADVSAPGAAGGAGAFSAASETAAAAEPPGLSLRGGQVAVLGTGAADAVEVALGSPHRLTVNGATYWLDPGVVRSVLVDARAGRDSVTLWGGPAAEVFQLWAGGGALLAPGATAVRVANAEAVYAFGGPADRAQLSGSAGSDTFVATPAYAYLSSAGLLAYAGGFGQVSATSGGGADVAALFDSAGDDTLVSGPGYAALSGRGFANVAWGFARAYAYATAGGKDSAFLYDSPGNDAFSGQGQGAGLLWAGGASVWAGGFDVVRLYGTAGGVNRRSALALLYVLQEFGSWVQG